MSLRGAPLAEIIRRIVRQPENFVEQKRFLRVKRCEFPMALSPEILPDFQQRIKSKGVRTHCFFPVIIRLVHNFQANDACGFRVDFAR